MSTPWAILPPGLRRAVASLPQAPVVTKIAYATTRHRLRILAFHGVEDQTHFRTLVGEICKRYVPVSGEDVRQHLDEGRPLPDHPVWFTFDDGLPSTFQVGPLLAEFGIRATAFVCPAVIDEPELLWFQVLELCQHRGLIAADEHDRFSHSRLKSVEDAVRRGETNVLRERLNRSGFYPEVTVTREDLRTWVGLGHEIGNHTWDHPCLDRCPVADQREQIVQAHEKLQGMGFELAFFAYPNGNWSVAAETTTRELGYSGSLLFDHRLTRKNMAAHRISRLRIDGNANTKRALSILSGAHSIAFSVVGR